MLHTNNPIIKHKAGLLNLARRARKRLKSLQDHGGIARYILSLSRARSRR